MSDHQYQITRREIKLFHAYMETMHDLLDQMSMDDDAKHFIDDDLLDSHYAVRSIAQDLLDKTMNKAEIY
jgi:hypothetical protein